MAAVVKDLLCLIFITAGKDCFTIDPNMSAIKIIEIHTSATGSTMDHFLAEVLTWRCTARSCDRFHHGHAKSKTIFSSLEIYDVLIMRMTLAPITMACRSFSVTCATFSLSRFQVHPRVRVTVLVWTALSHTQSRLLTYDS